MREYGLDGGADGGRKKENCAKRNPSDQFFTYRDPWIANDPRLTPTPTLSSTCPQKKRKRLGNTEQARLTNKNYPTWQHAKPPLSSTRDSSRDRPPGTSCWNRACRPLEATPRANPMASMLAIWRPIRSANSNMPVCSLPLFSLSAKEGRRIFVVPCQCQ